MPTLTHPPAPERQRARISVLLAAALCVVLASGLGWMLSSRAKPAPDARFVTLQGQRFATADLRGKVVLVNFWATSCTICLHEMPQMVATFERYNRRGLEYVAVAMRDDPPNYVLDYAESRKLPFRVTLDPDGALAQAFGNVDATPTTFLIDRQGRIVKRYLGEPDFTELHQLIEAQLGA